MVECTKKCELLSAVTAKKIFGLINDSIQILYNMRDPFRFS